MVVRGEELERNGDGVTLHLSRGQAPPSAEKVTTFALVAMNNQMVSSITMSEDDLRDARTPK